MSASVLKKKIVFPGYSALPNRINSYKTCSHGFLSEYKDLFSEAGFFYTGKDDETICYYCGGGLKDWDEEKDNPWIEHARWFPKCPFVIVNRGQEFVEEHSNRKNKNPAEQKRISTSKIVVPDETMNEGLECLVCYSSERSIVFLPCKHCCTCSKCGLCFDNCVYCRRTITDIMEIYIV